MRIRALIVDDEELARSEMRFLLREQPDIEVIGEASGGEEAVRMAVEDDPDLIFLDIQMPVVDGFKVVSTLMDQDRLPVIIFTTAYDPLWVYSHYHDPANRDTRNNSNNPKNG